MPFPRAFICSERNSGVGYDLTIPSLTQKLYFTSFAFWDISRGRLKHINKMRWIFSVTTCLTFSFIFMWTHRHLFILSSSAAIFFNTTQLNSLTTLSVGLSIGWLCPTQKVRPPPTKKRKVPGMAAERGVTFHCYYSQVHSDPEW